MVTKRFLGGTFESGNINGASGNGNGENTCDDGGNVTTDRLTSCPQLAIRAAEDGLVWFRKLLLRTRQPSPQLTYKHLLVTFFYYYYSLIDCFSLCFYSTTHSAAQTNTHIYNRTRVFACMATVAAPLYSQVIMPKTHLRPLQNGSLTVLWASWSLCLSSWWVENPRKLCVFLCECDTRPDPHWRVVRESKLGYTKRNTAAPLNKEATIVPDQTQSKRRSEPLSTWGLTPWRIQWW